jgi:hypothetical protein
VDAPIKVDPIKVDNLKLTSIIKMMRCSAAAEPSNTKAPPLLDATADDINDMILEYTSEDMFGDCA